MQVTVVDHPLAAQLLTRLRDETTDRAGFRRAMDDLSGILVYEATRDLEVETFEVQTPLATATGVRVATTAQPVGDAGVRHLLRALGSGGGTVWVPSLQTERLPAIAASEHAVVQPA